ncbi:MAG TPA: DUF4331 domain-containing protein [Thermoanaerobaculia bacterium]|nr:DUF4331 domain-containing protein [Thermoanaerobaculia bacterium]
MLSRTPAAPRAAARSLTLAAVLVPLALCAAAPALASSHGDAPTLVEMPQVAAADFYMFRSYEPGRDGFVTFLADYNPMQDPFGGPTYFPLRQNAYYDIRVDANGDGVEDLTFRFFFQNTLPLDGAGLGVPVPFPTGPVVPVAIAAVGPFGPGTTPPPLPGGALNWLRSYTVRVIRGPVGKPTSVDFLSDAASGTKRFTMPFDDIGAKTIPQYDAYARQYLYDVNIPGCSGTGKLFVGQRQDPFAMNIGEFFDLVNLNPVGSPAAAPSSMAHKNVTTLALEVPIACLGAGSSGVVAGWTSASLPANRQLIADPTFTQPYVESGPFMQVSRMGNPLVAMAAIGLAEKNLYEASAPAADGQFRVFFQRPSVPVGIQILTCFPPAPGPCVTPPTNVPRHDLVGFYLEGLPGINADRSGAEVVRLNTNIPPVPALLQNNLGVLGSDLAGFPNGRRPGDDVVDVTLRVLEGALCYQNLGLCVPADAPAGVLPFTDQAWVDATQFQTAFPYLNSPLPGSPNPTRVWNAALTGSTGDAGTCAGLLTTDQSALAITCAHDLVEASQAEIVQGANVVCNLAGAASPILGTCPLGAAQLLLLQQQKLTVIIASPGASISGPLQ